MKIIFMVNIHIFQILKSSTCVFKKDKTEPFFNDFLDRLALVNCAWNHATFYFRFLITGCNRSPEEVFLKIFSPTFLGCLGFQTNLRLWKSRSCGFCQMITSIFEHLVRIQEELFEHPKPSTIPKFFFRF